MRSRKKIIGIFLISLLVLLAVQEAALFKFKKEESLITQLRKKWLYSSAIEKGLEFYTPPKMEQLKTDEYFLLKEISKNKNYPVPTDLEKKYSSDPFKRIWNKDNYARNVKFYLRDQSEINGQPINNSFYFVNPPNNSFLSDPWDDVILKALYCDISGYNDYDFSVLRSIGKGDGGYWDTHLLLGLLLLKKNGCYDAQKIAEEKEITANHIISAAKEDQLWSDLYAERLVLLYWAGKGDFIKKSWTDMVRDNLTDDPGWRTGKTFSSNAHTTGLALLSLLYYREGEKYQLFYR